jgi:hypothetical protein
MGEFATKPGVLGGNGKEPGEEPPTHSLLNRSDFTAEL